MLDLLHFLDKIQLPYTLLCLGLFVLFLYSAVVPFWQKNNQKERILKGWLLAEASFLALIFVSVAIARLPIMFYYTELNPDESLYIAEALTAREKIFFWKYIDSTTHGPLDIYPILLFSLGGSINYFSLRFTRFFCVFGMLLFVYWTKRDLFDNSIARLCMIPIVSFSAFYKYNDFTNYSSEHIPILCLSIGIFLLAKIFQAKEVSTKQVIGLGLILGAMPFTKLQAVPIALVVAGFAYLLLWKKGGYSIKTAGKNLLAFSAGGLLIPLIFFLSIIATDSFEPFWQMYFLSNFSYSYSSNDLSIIGRLIEWVRLYTGSMAIPFWLFLGSIGTTLFLFIRKHGFIKKENKQLFLFLVAFLAVSIFSALKPGGFFPHYLLFWIMPFTFLFTFFVNEIYHTGSQHYNIKGISNLKAIGLATLVFAFAAAQQFGLINKSALRNDKLFGNLANTYLKAQNATNTLLIKKHSQPDDSMMIWGWEAKYYGWAQRHMATPYSYIYSFHGDYIPQESRNYHKENFLQHFKESQPKIFIDAVGPGNYYQDKAKYGFENFKPFAALIQKEYTLIGHNDNVSIYKRKDTATSEK